MNYSCGHEELPRSRPLICPVRGVRTSTRKACKWRDAGDPNSDGLVLSGSRSRKNGRSRGNRQPKYRSDALAQPEAPAAVRASQISSAPPKGSISRKDAMVGTTRDNRSIGKHSGDPSGMRSAYDEGTSCGSSAAMLLQDDEEDWERHLDTESRSSPPS